MYRSINPIVTKLNPEGEIVYEGPDVPKGWKRPQTDHLGRFMLSDGRPGRLICPGQMETRIWA